MKKPTIICLFALTLGVLSCWLVSGCAADQQQIDQITQLKNGAADVIGAVLAENAALKARLTTQPAGEERDRLIKLIDSGNSKLVVAQATLDTANVLLDAARKGDVAGAGEALAPLLAKIPGVGQYGVFASLLAGWGVGIYQRIKKQQVVEHLTNVVRSMEVAGPDWSEQDKAAIKEEQGPETSLVVESIKNDLAN